MYRSPYPFPPKPSRERRVHRVYFRVWGKYWIRTWVRLVNTTTEYRHVRAVADNIFPYTFRGRPRIIVREW